MKTKYRFAVAFATLLSVSSHLRAQCTVSSPCGYSMDIFIKPLSIVPTSTNCPWGYNYDVTFSYTININGTNTCYDDNIGYQPQINCNGQNSSYYTINVAAPTVGAGAVNSSVSGTLTTSTNQYTSANDCATATPQSLNCNSLQVTIFGPGISSNTYPCSFSTLPVTLLDFSAKYQNDVVTLHWATVAEKNNAFFTVEQSSDGSNWKSVAERRGAGNSNILTQYELTDKNFSSGLNYYRLKQTDSDGSFSYSEIRVVNTLTRSANFVLFPNPFNDAFHLRSETKINGSYTVRNSLGQELHSGIVEQETTIDLQTHAAGIYFIEIKYGNSQENFKLIKR